MANLTPNDKLVMHAFTALANAAPGANDYMMHRNYIDQLGKKAYIDLLNTVFANFTDTQLADLLLTATGLNGVDLEGDGNIDNMRLATKFIHAHAGNRIQAILDFTETLSTITTGPLRDIATAFNDKIDDGFDYAKHYPVSTFHNDNIQIVGTAGDDVFYADNPATIHANKAYTVAGETYYFNPVWIFGTEGQRLMSGSFGMQYRYTNDPSRQFSTLKGMGEYFGYSYGMKVRVTYKGLHSQEVAVDDRTDFIVTTTEVNHAIKQAINGDAVLSKLLGTVDGSDGILAIISKTYGHGDEGDLSIDVIPPLASEISPEAVAFFSQPDFFIFRPVDSNRVREFIEGVADGGLGIQRLYTPQMLHDDNNEPITGSSDVIVARDHIIHGSAGDDVIVLGSSWWNSTHDINTNNDTIKYTGAFGHDTILNFSRGPALNPTPGSTDKFDFTLLHRTSYNVATAVTSSISAWGFMQNNIVGTVTDGQIHLARKYSVAGVTAATTDNGSVEDVKQLFTDAGAGKVAKQLYIAGDINTNTLDVYQIVDGVEANDLTVNLLGRISLDDEGYRSMSSADVFV